jgi:glycine cleavage system H protein
VNPEQLRFTSSHEWLRVEDQGGQAMGTVGISAFAVEALTDLVYLDLPAVGKLFKAQEPFGQVESVKAVSDLYAPVALRVTRTNTELAEHLEWLSTDPYGKGWIIQGELLDAREPAALLDYAAYQKQCAEEGH